MRVPASSRRLRDFLGGCGQAPCVPRALNQGWPQVVPGGLLVVTAVRLRIPAEGDLALGSYTDWPIATAADAFGTWLTCAETWLDAWTGAVRQSVTRSGMPPIQAAIPR